MEPSGIAIKVEHASKSFRIPTKRVNSLRERVVTRRSAGYETMPVLKDVSFEIRQGEFFGIAGRNGSGKSTLLRLIASLYRLDQGRIRVAGHLAPFIELGVGFNPDLPAYDNVVMNAVMMGLSPSEARKRFEEIIDFAELEDFVNLEMKNYSSGMNLRLAFSIMVHVDADVFLFDEVLAVGDGRFQAKCAEVFERMRASGRTGVLVTHAMPALELLCDRAMVLENGEVLAIGDTEEVAEAYDRLQLHRRRRQTDAEIPHE